LFVENYGFVKRTQLVLLNPWWKL